jgi:hypothetical protein
VDYQLLTINCMQLSSCTIVSPLGYASNQLINTKGKVVGERVSFSNQSAKQIALELASADPSLSKSAIRKQVNACLTGQIDSRWMIHMAHESAMRSKGIVPDYTDIKARSAVTHYIIPVDAPAKAAKKSTKLADKLAAAQKQNDELLARLAALEAKLAK